MLFKKGERDGFGKGGYLDLFMLGVFYPSFFSSQYDHKISLLNVMIYFSFQFVVPFFFITLLTICQG